MNYNAPLGKYDPLEKRVDLLALYKDQYSKGIYKYYQALRIGRWIPIAMIIAIMVLGLSSLIHPAFMYAVLPLAYLSEYIANKYEIYKPEATTVCHGGWQECQHCQARQCLADIHKLSMNAADLFALSKAGWTYVMHMNFKFNGHSLDVSRHVKPLCPKCSKLERNKDAVV